MKILHVIWRPRIGGAELFALSLARYQSNNHNVYIYYLGAKDDVLPETHGFSIVAGTMSSGFDLAGFKHFYGFVKNSSFDVVHNHQNLPAVAVALLATPRALHVRHEHGTSYAGWKTTRERLLSRLISRFVPVYIANSESTKSKVIEHEKVNGRKIHVIPCGIELSRFSGRHSNGMLHKELGLKKNVFILGYLGRLHPQKGVDDFVKIACRILSAKPNVHCVITGDGDLRGDIEAKIKDENMQSRFTLLGFRNDVPDVLANYDTLAITSRWEPQGLVAAEAMASGVPIVSFAVDGLPEVIGDVGSLIVDRDIDDMVAAIFHIIEDEGLRSQYTRKGYLRAQNFDLKTITNEIINIYNKYL